MRVQEWVRGEWRLTLRRRANGAYEVTLRYNTGFVVSRDYQPHQRWEAEEHAYMLAAFGSLVRVDPEPAQWEEEVVGA